MLYREIIAVCSEIHTKHINTLCGQNVEFVNVKPGGAHIKLKVQNRHTGGEVLIPNPSEPGARGNLAASTTLRSLYPLERPATHRSEKWCVCIQGVSRH